MTKRLPFECFFCLLKAFDWSLLLDPLSSVCVYRPCMFCVHARRGGARTNP